MANKSVFPTDHQSHEPIRKLIEVDWSTAIRQRKWDDLLALCREDIVYMPADHPALYGLLNFRGWLEQLPPISVFEQKCESIEIHNDLALTRSTFTATIELPEVSITRTGKTLGALHRTMTGTWLTTTACFNYNEPENPGT